MKLIEHLDSILTALAAIVASIGSWRAAKHAKEGKAISTDVWNSVRPPEDEPEAQTERANYKCTQ